MKLNCSAICRTVFYLQEEKMVVEQESITAKLCAFARAWHSIKSKNKIFDDYLAFDIMGKGIVFFVLIEFFYGKGVYLIGSVCFYGYISGYLVY